MATRKIEDFGEKIGGARKDLYALWNINDLTSEELSAATRDKIWKRPNIQKELDNGTDVLLLFWREQIRKSFPTKPWLGWRNDEPELCRAFIEAVAAYKEFAENSEVIDQSGLQELNARFFDNKGRYATCKEKYKCLRGSVTPSIATFNEQTLEKLCRRERFGQTATQKKHDDLARNFEVLHYVGEAKESVSGDICFLKKKADDVMEIGIQTSSSYGTRYVYPREECFRSVWEPDTYVVFQRYKVVAINLSDESAAKKLVEDLIDAELAYAKAAKKGKQAFPFQLQHVEQRGGVKTDTPVSGQQYLAEFGFRGGEFGNWMNENDRQASMDMGYIALRNLANALNIRKDDIALDGLAIAFGARGHSSARAHFEPGRNVINLTKMTGAGALAHEWGHALDFFLGKTFCGGGMYSEQKQQAFPEMDTILTLMQKKSVDIDVEEETRKEREKCERELKHLLGDSVETAEMIASLLNNPPADTSDERIDKLTAGQRGTKKHDNSLRIYVTTVRLKGYLEGRYTTRDVLTDFLKGSEYFDKTFRKENGYWSSKVEMFARAFDCYVSDKLKQAGVTDTYLTGFANSFAWAVDDGTVRGTGEAERGVQRAVYEAPGAWILWRGRKGSRKGI